jgi:hypothetical protein
MSDRAAHFSPMVVFTDFWCNAYPVHGALTVQPLRAWRLAINETSVNYTFAEIYGCQIP